MPNVGMNAPGPGIDEYESPPWLFKALDGEFGFTFDAAASEQNRLCKRWTDDVLRAAIDPTDRIFCNPPYSLIPIFVDKALASPNLWVMLLPVRTDSEWFRKLSESERVAFRFFRKRICFNLPGGTLTSSPRFASMIAIIRSR